MNNKKIKDLTGLKFHRLLVKKYTGKDKFGKALWECVCECGTIKSICGESLGSGKIKSCGCLYFDSNTKHGATKGRSHSPTYSSWSNMINRCINILNPRYPEWGGRGIKVCERWRNYENFLADMGERLNSTTLDRINNNGDYEPGNCRWATPKQQVDNRNYKTIADYAAEYMRANKIDCITARDKELIKTIADLAGAKEKGEYSNNNIIGAIRRSPKLFRRSYVISDISNGPLAVFELMSESKDHFFTINPITYELRHYVSPEAALNESIALNKLDECAPSFRFYRGKLKQKQIYLGRLSRKFGTDEYVIREDKE